MWTQEYEACRRLLNESAPEAVREQLDAARETAPELVAAFHLLSLALEHAVFEADRRDSPTVAHLLPRPVLRAVIASPLIISPERLCMILEKVAARRALDALAQGRPIEPGPGCGHGMANR